MDVPKPITTVLIPAFPFDEHFILTSKSGFSG
jgi:hypothetical protein